MRSAVPCGVAVIDLNRFKETNDRHGHAAGDVVLRDVADLLVTLSPAGSVIARTGGDEFAILLLDVDEPWTDAFGRRLAAHTGTTIPHVDTVVTLAVGTAWPRAGPCCRLSWRGPTG